MNQGEGLWVPDFGCRVLGVGLGGWDSGKGIGFSNSLKSLMTVKGL
jgi:hypothetical protein